MIVHWFELGLMWMLIRSAHVSGRGTLAQAARSHKSQDLSRLELAWPTGPSRPAYLTSKMMLATIVTRMGSAALPLRPLNSMPMPCAPRILPGLSFAAPCKSGGDFADQLGHSNRVTVWKHQVKIQVNKGLGRGKGTFNAATTPEGWPLSSAMMRRASARCRAAVSALHCPKSSSTSVPSSCAGKCRSSQAAICHFISTYFCG